MGSFLPSRADIEIESFQGADPVQNQGFEYLLGNARRRHGRCHGRGQASFKGLEDGAWRGNESCWSDLPASRVEK